MKKKLFIAIGVGIALILGLSVTSVAADSPNNLAAPQAITKAQGIKILIRINNEANLQTILGRLQSAGKIDQQQASHIQGVWEKIHETQGGRFVARLLVINDQAKFDAAIAKLQQAGKLTPDQVTKLENAWAAIHSG